MTRWHGGPPRYDRMPPPWWPHDEPWPPRGGRSLREHRRERFVRRSGWYSFWPLWVLLWLAASFGRRGFGGGFPFGRGIALLLACAAVAGAVAVIIRRMAGPVADIVSAADRIAHRDYDVRVREPEFGPA